MSNTKNSKVFKFLKVTRTDKGKDFKNCSLLLITKRINEIAGDVALVKKLENGTVLVKATSQAQVENLMELKEIKEGINIKVAEYKNLNQSVGVIKNKYFTGFGDGDVVTELGLEEHGVIGLQKFTKKIDGTTKETGSYKLKFKTPNPPTSVKCYGIMEVDINPYYAPVIRCKNCLKFGHLTQVCRNKKTCSNCGSSHSVENDSKCINNTKCINCHDNHLSTSKHCPVYLKEQEIQKIKATYKVSYGKALELYKDHENLIPKKTESRPHSTKPKCSAHNCEDHHHEENQAAAAAVSEPKPVKSLQVGNVTLLPKNLTNAQKRRLKKKNKKK